MCGGGVDEDLEHCDVMSGVDSHGIRMRLSFGDGQCVGDDCVVLHELVRTGGRFSRRHGGDLGRGAGTGLPVGTARRAGSQASGVEAMNDGVAVTFGSADEVATSVVFATARGVVRGVGAGGGVGEPGTADAVVEFGFFCVDGGDPGF